MQNTTNYDQPIKNKADYEQLEDFGNKLIGFYFIEKFVASTQDFRNSNIEDGISLISDCLLMSSLSPCLHLALLKLLK